MKTFCIWASIWALVVFLPPMVIAALGAFLHLDATLLNPIMWPQGARGAFVGWFLFAHLLGFMICKDL